jgi:hypothetical protein
MVEVEAKCRPGDTHMACLVFVLQVLPGTDADVAVGPSVSAEGALVEEAEAEKAALPVGEGGKLEEAIIDTETTEVVDSDRPQSAETEAAAAPQVSVVMREALGRRPSRVLCLLVKGDMIALYMWNTFIAVFLFIYIYEYIYQIIYI